MTIVKIFLSCAGVALLAGPALAANQPAVGEVPVPGGDLGCVIRLSMVTVDAMNTAEDASKAEQVREKARDMVRRTKEESAYFLGRLSMQPADNQRRISAAQLFRDFRAEPPDRQTAETLTCSNWSRQHQADVRRSMKSKA